MIATILCSVRSSRLYLKYLLSIILISIISLFLIIQPDIGQTLLVVFSCAVLIFTSGISIFLLVSFSIFAFIPLAYLIIYVLNLIIFKVGFFHFLIEKQELIIFNPIKLLSPLQVVVILAKE